MSIDSLIDNEPILLTDKEFDAEKIYNISFDKHIFTRVSAVSKTFEKVSFKYAVFDDCYFRNCKFIDCDFTGAQFKGASYRGSEFSGSRFDYARFNNTKITNSILDFNIPGYENVALEFAQSLRVNFGQIGDTLGVNKAIEAELKATKVHLSKAAWAKDGWYKKKYKGINRLKIIRDYITFNAFDFIWGNGESLYKLLRSIFIVISIILLNLLVEGYSFNAATSQSFSLFLGINTSVVESTGIVQFAISSRFILLGMFVSVLVKRLSRR